MSRSLQNSSIGPNCGLDRIPDDDEVAALGNSMARVAHVRPKLLNVMSQHKRHQSGLQKRKPRLIYLHPIGSSDPDPQSGIGQEINIVSLKSLSKTDRNCLKPLNLEAGKPSFGLNLQKSPIIKISSINRQFTDKSVSSNIEGTIQIDRTLRNGINVRQNSISCIKSAVIPPQRGVFSYVSLMDDLLNKEIDGPVEIDVTISRIDSPKLDGTRPRSKPILKLRKDTSLKTTERTQASRLQTRFDFVEQTPQSLRSDCPKRVTFSRNRIVVSYCKDDESGVGKDI